MSLPDYIVDAHVHFWDPRRLGYGWLASVPALNRSFLPDDYAVATAAVNIGKMIFVESGCASSQNRGEVKWISELAARETRLKGIIAHAPLEHGDAVRNELAALATHSLVKGIRRNLQDEADVNYCLQAGFISGVRALAEFDFSFDLCIVHRQLPAVIEMVRRCPEVRFVLDHCGKPAIRSQLFESWAGQLKAMSAFPNVFCKISGLLTEADLASWKLSDLQPFIRHAIDCFGFDRVLFGGDWPVLTLAENYPRWLETLLAAIPFATAAELGKLFKTNAEEIYHV